MRHSRSGVAAIACVLLLSGASAAQAQAVKPDELRDLSCLTGLAATASRGPSDKTAAMENVKLATMYFAGKVAGRHPGQKVVAQLAKNKAAIQVAVPKLDGQSCMAEAANALKMDAPGK